ncbi:MAG: hypothetical protein IIZ54_06455 [Selenomonadaceae bacterium]|nr:hypothetical protein [Selenomonadaceae bacterium]
MKKTIGFLLGVLLCIGIAASGYCCYSERTPEYALSQAAKAVREKDDALLVQYVDVEGLFAAAYDEGSEELAKEVENLHAMYPEDFFFWHDTAFMREYTKEHRTYALRLLQGIRQAYFTQTPPAASIEENPVTWLAGETEKFQQESEGECTGIREEGDKAYASILIHGRDTDYGRLADKLLFELELEKQPDGKWKIMRVSNVKDLVYPVTESAEKYWPMQGWQ